MSNDFLNKIVSVQKNRKHKVYTFFGGLFRISLKRNNLRNRVRQLEAENERILRMLAGANSGSITLSKLLSMYNLPAINRDYVNSQVELMKESGINTLSRNQKVIVSLTSYPERMYDIHLCLYSLLTQNYKPDAVILWLAEEQFPNKEADIPRKVLALKQWGLEIRWCPDYRSFKKIIPALQIFPEDIIVTADDDLYYEPDWLQALWDEYQRSDKQSIIAHRCHKVTMKAGKISPYSRWPKCIQDNSKSFLNFSTNGGGTLFPPHTLAEDICEYDKIKTICPKGDDIWIWGMAVLKGTQIQVVKEPHSIRFINPAREANMNEDVTLWATNRIKNDEQIQNMIVVYPEIEKIIKHFI